MKPEDLLERVDAIAPAALDDVQQVCTLQGSPANEGCIIAQLIEALPDTMPSIEPDAPQNYAEFDTSPNTPELS